MKNYYGIDLGTTNSVICSIENNRPFAYTIGRQDSYSVPSVVYYPVGKDPIVGHAAKNTLLAFPKLCIQHIKREMGNDSFSRVINDDKKTPESVSADILRELVKRANEVRTQQGQETISDVVVSIPAKFGDAERRRTIKAVKLAGLNLISLVHEPTAAALSFGINKNDNKTFVVYDLGGGTFDVNVMRISDNKLKILAKGGDLNCGGIDWDTEIVRLALASCINEEPKAKNIFTDSSGNAFREYLKSDEGQATLAAAEEVKINLCESSEDCAFTFKFDGKNQTKIIAKDKFFPMTSHLVTKTIESMKKTIQEAGISLDNIENEIDEIIMVGGSSYMPQIETALRANFKVKNIHRQDVGQAVAKGAALFAYLQDRSWADTLATANTFAPNTKSTTSSTDGKPQSRATTDRTKSTGTICSDKTEERKTQIVTTSTPTIEDIGGFSYGLAIRKGNSFVLYNAIFKDDNIEVSKSFKNVFATNHDNMRIIDLDVRENDSKEKIVDNAHQFKCITPNAKLRLASPVPKGTSVSIEFTRSQNGIITITASCAGSRIDVEIKR